MVHVDYINVPETEVSSFDISEAESPPKGSAHTTECVDTVFVLETSVLDCDMDGYLRFASDRQAC